MKSQNWNPGTLLQLSGSYWQAFALHAGVELDLFTVLGDRKMTGKQVADHAKTDQRATMMLLNALSAMDLVNKEQEYYSASEPAQKFLNKNSEHYIGYMIMHHHHLSSSWSALDQAVRTGGPVRERAAFHDEKWREAFLMGMYTNASLQAPELVEQIDLAGCTSLLDLGGGPGTYAIHFCRRFPQLKAVVFDLPGTRPFAERTIERYDLRDRIRYVAGNYLDQDIPGKYDAIWMSHILHAEDARTCALLIRKAAAALAPGGKILIHDFILENSMDGPLFAALFSLNMLIGTPGGQSYSEKQIMQWLIDAGLDKIRRLPYRGPTDSGVISATGSL
jgi:SAM-dependent methyltransferase